MKNFRPTLILSILLLAIAASSAFAQTSSFSYQGEFSNAGSPANGPYDMEFRLFDAAAGGTQIGSTVTRSGVMVTDGIFGVILDFGLTAFPGADRFVEISVRPQGGQFSTLSPRSQMLSSPYAIRAKNITGPINGTSASATLTVTNDQPGITNPSPQNLPPAALRGEATSTVDANIGLLGIASGSSGAGVIGIGNGGGAGVLGLSTSMTGDTEGLSGEVLSPDGTALDLHMPTGGTGHLISASSAKITRFTVNSDGNVTARGSVTANGVNSTGNVTASGSVTANGVNSTGDVTASGIVTAISVNSTGNVTANGSLTANGVNSTSGVNTVQLNAQAISVQSLGVSGPVQMNNGAGIIGNLSVNGNLNVTGTKNAVATLPDGRRVLLYATESPENWFEDFGTIRLRNGRASVRIDKTFAEAANVAVPYMVFLTPGGNCRGLYVTRKTATTFEVRELGNGRSNTAFDFRIVARRRGFEAVRFAPAPAKPESR